MAAEYNAVARCRALRQRDIFDASPLGLLWDDDRNWPAIIEAVRNLVKDIRPHIANPYVRNFTQSSLLIRFRSLISTDRSQLWLDLVRVGILHCWDANVVDLAPNNDSFLRFGMKMLSADLLFDENVTPPTHRQSIVKSLTEALFAQEEKVAPCRYTIVSLIEQQKDVELPWLFRHIARLQVPSWDKNAEQEEKQQWIFIADLVSNHANFARYIAEAFTFYGFDMNIRRAPTDLVRRLAVQQVFTLKDESLPNVFHGEHARRWNIVLAIMSSTGIYRDLAELIFQYFYAFE